MLGSRTLARVVLAVAALAVVLLTAEAVLRLAAWRSQQNARAAAAEWRAAHPDEAALPELGGVLALAQKNVRGLHKGVVVRTNALGLRGPDHQAAAAPGVLRIVVAGDSFTFGSGVAEADTYTSVLPRLLDTSRAPQRHEAINAGLAGAAIDGVLDRLALAVGAYRPALVVYGFTPNDIEGPEYRLLDEDESRRAWLAWSGGHPLVLVRWAGWQLATIGAASAPADQPYVRELQRNYFENEAAWARFAAGLDRLARIADDAGVCAVVLIHTHLTDLGSEHPFLPVYDRVAEAARARGLFVATSFDVFSGREPSALWINPLDTHPNAEGHALLAGALARAIGALPERCLAGPTETATAAADGDAPGDAP